MSRIEALLNPEGLKVWRSNHPWITAKHLAQKLPQVPCVIPIGGRLFFLSPQSHLRLREIKINAELSDIVVSNEQFEKLLLEPLTHHLKNLLAIKQNLVGGDALFRWVFAENDGLPGLVIDVFENKVVCQIQSAPVEYFWKTILQAIRSAFGRDCDIIERRNAKVRLKEGLSLEDVTFEGEASVYNWNGLKWWMQPGQSQKTGAYLDQRQNHLLALRWAQQLDVKTALDVCSFEGGFGLHLQKAGIKVTGVDSSQIALDTYQKNAELNEVTVDVVRSDAFEFLRAFHKSGQKTDCVILDPPPLARDSEHREAAARAFYDLNLRAVLSLNSGGLLVSCSCSHAMGENEILKTLRKVSRETSRTLKVLQTSGPSPDHAASVLFPEGNYLSAFFVLCD